MRATSITALQIFFGMGNPSTRDDPVLEGK